MVRQHLLKALNTIEPALHQIQHATSKCKNLFYVSFFSTSLGLQHPEVLHGVRNEENRTKADDLCGAPMAVGTLEEIINHNHAIISTLSGPEFYIVIMSIVGKDSLEPGCSVLLHHKTQAIIDVLQDDTDPMVSVMKLDNAPMESYADVGGLDQQIQEIKMGIRPPKGVILYGVPGTRKTLLAKAVTNQMSVLFLRAVGFELIQKYLSSRPKLLDNFDTRGDVEVIMATNRAESLDPALICPGRIDRKIESPLPDVKTKRHIFELHTSGMSLSEDVRPRVHHAISPLHTTSPELKQPPFLCIFLNVVLRYL
ncbi:P-loop containing nucleoside triphosphate hydrolase protein [Phellopilus nigrolimitatus]|nr:P-loop containing nucleoside triphosphate hydrolase protein [Phellopilus nigrolimitatus]